MRGRRGARQDRCMHASRKISSATWPHSRQAAPALSRSRMGSLRRTSNSSSRGSGGPPSSAPPPARAPPRPGERGVTVWDGNRTSMLSPGSTTQREMKAVRLPSPAHAPRLTDLPHWSLPPPRSQPIHLACRVAPQNRAITGDLGPRRAISGDLALFGLRGFPAANKKENRGSPALCVSGNFQGKQRVFGAPFWKLKRVSLSLRAGLGQNLRQN